MARSRSAPLVLEIPAFNGGVNILAEPDKLPPNVARRCNNMVLDELGGAVKRLGVDNAATSFGSASDRVLSMAVFYRAGADDHIIRHLSTGAVQRGVATSGGLPTSWTDIWTGLSTTVPFAYAQFNSKIYMSNGVDDYRWWDGTTGSTSGTAPKGKTLRVWKDTMWVSAVDANPDRVYSSAAGDAETFPALNFVDINKGSGDGVITLASDANALVVFKDRETHAIYDPVEFTNRIVDSQIGCPSRFSVVYHDGIIYFWSLEGICVYYGDAPNQIISDPISPVWDLGGVWDFPSVDSVWGYNYQKKVGWIFPRHSVPTTKWQVEYHRRLPDTPWVFHSMPVNLAISFQSRLSAFGELLYGSFSNDNEMAVLYDDDQDNGAGYSAIYTTGWFDFDQPDRSKYIRRIRLNCRGVFTLKLYIDLEDDTPAKAITINGPTGEDFGEVTVHPDIYCRRLALSFEDSSQSGTQNIFYPIADMSVGVARGKWGIFKAMIEAVPMGEFR